MKIKIQVTITYEGYIHDNDYLESPTEKPLPEDVDKRILEDVSRSPRYYTDRFPTKAVEVKRLK